MKHWHNYIGGQWCSAQGAYDVPNPATEAIEARVPDGTVADIERAVETARKTFDETAWRHTALGDRIGLLERVADGVEKRKEIFREILISTAGAEYPSHWMQLEAPIQLLRNYAELALEFPYREVMPPVASLKGDNTSTETLLVRQPVGVCALIPTWNFPLWVSCQKIAPALLAGCTMIVKPSPWSPLADLLLAEVMEEAGVPAGVFNVVSSQSLAVSQALVSSPLIDMVSFTGSNASGQAIMQAAGRNLSRCHLELGGKSAHIILDDYDLDQAAAAASLPVAMHGGQGCALLTRVLVPRHRHDALLDKMKRHIETHVVIGNPADPDVVLGPVIRPEHRDRIESYIASGLAQGADLVTGGLRPAHLPQGWYIEPTVFGNVDNKMRIAQEEIFGPVICVIPYDDEEHALRIANDSNYGLFGGILTEDRQRAIGLAMRMRAGGVSINGAVNTFFKPSGGFKQSGIGRENGKFGLEMFTELQAVMWEE